VMTRSVRLLAQLTRQVALVQYPSLVQSAVLHIELIRLSETRLLLVLIADTGRVEQRTVDLPAAMSEDDVAVLRARLISTVIGEKCAELADRLAPLVESFDESARPAVAALVASLIDATADTVEQRIVLGGTANLARYRDAFAISLEPVLEALEEQVVLLRLLGEVSGDVTVRIGHENPVEDLHGTSLVATGYGRGDAVVAGVGVVGPTHMDYPGTIASVTAVAQYLSRILDEQ
jgi:heat-inducible transcriptional repressor